MITAPGTYHHKNVRLNPRNYIGKSAYFITLCCFERRKIFTKPTDCAWLENQLRELSSARAFAIHAFCFMPDHLHLLIQGLEPRSDLLVFIKTFKIRTSREFLAKHQLPLWQKKYYDHVLRPGESLASVAWYIWLNPVRAGLAPVPADYPFVGSFTTSIPATSPLRDWIPPHEKQSRPPQKAASTKTRPSASKV